MQKIGVQPTQSWYNICRTCAHVYSGLKVIKLLSISTKLCMKLQLLKESEIFKKNIFFLLKHSDVVFTCTCIMLINVKMPTIMSRKKSCYVRVNMKKSFQCQVSTSRCTRCIWNVRLTLSPKLVRQIVAMTTTVVVRILKVRYALLQMVDSQTFKRPKFREEKQSRCTIGPPLISLQWRVDNDPFLYAD